MQTQLRHNAVVLVRRDGRVVDYNGLENRRAERHRGFESLSLRSIVLLIYSFRVGSQSVVIQPFFMENAYGLTINEPALPLTPLKLLSFIIIIYLFYYIVIYIIYNVIILYGICGRISSKLIARFCSQLIALFSSKLIALF